MAEAPSNQDQSMKKTKSSIRSLENNVAELIAQDMRDLELEDARETVKSASEDREPGTLYNKTDTASSPRRTRSNMDENLVAVSENINQTRRSSWRDKFSTEELSHEPVTGSWREQSSREENTCNTSAQHRGDRVRSDEETHEMSAPTRARQYTEESPQGYVAGSYRRGSWRDRLYGEGSKQEASVSSRDTPDKEENLQDHVPGSYRRGSWRERLKRDETVQQSSTRLRRERLNRTESAPEAPLDSLRSRQDTEYNVQSHVVGSYRRGSWRERLRREENEQTDGNIPVGAPNDTQSSHSDMESASIVHNVPQENHVEVVSDVPDDRSHEVVSENAEAESDSTATQTEVKKDSKEAKTWTVEEVLKLLVKAINYRSPLKDIETILRWQFDINLPHKQGLRALHYAAYTNYVSCVELLLNKGANINITDDIGYTPLHLAASSGHYKTMEKLIENGAMITFNQPGVEIRKTDEVNKLGFTNTEPVNLAIQNHHPECAALLLQNGARADNKYFMGYEISLAPLDDIRCIEVLLKYGASPNVFNRCGMSPLMKACKEHHIDAVRLLLQHGADYNAQCPPLFEQKSVLQVAIESGNIVIINLLLMKSPKISRYDNYNYSALHTAIMKGRADICRLLLQKGADPEERTEAGATPLMIACSMEDVRERKEIIQMLLDSGADVNAYGENFSYVDPYLSPIAEYFKTIGSAENFNIIECLISHGARIHFTTGDVLLGGRRDPFAILPFAHSMHNSPEIFDLTMQAAQRYNPLAVHVCDNLPEDMKNTLLLVATQPRELKQLVRLAIRHILVPDLFDNVMELPLPELLKSYLLFK